MWPEVQKARKETKRELILDGEDISKRISTEGLDADLFKLTDLNFLRISNTALNQLDSRISDLAERLADLDLHQNRLEVLPDSISNLLNLKTLNLSGNRLIAIPEALCKLANLLTLNVSQNEIVKLPDFSGLTNLHELYVTSNRLEELPSGLHSLQHLMTINADHNTIKELPANIHEISQLKSLHLRHNSLVTLPSSLCLLEKLKTLDLRDNKFSDKKLLKLANVDQTQPKGVFKYLKPIYDKDCSAKALEELNNANPEEESFEEFIQIIHSADVRASGVVVQITERLTDVRPYIVCCILRGLSLNKTSTAFKQFIALQTRLHEDICEKRLGATIATHDLRAVKSPLTYDALNPKQTMIVPLGRQKALSAADFMVKLHKEAEEVRKAKKRNAVGGIHKYLDLLKDKPLYPFLLDQEGAVISFPPITNSEYTKISEETRDILLEVTSSRSLLICKQVMEKLILEVFSMNIGNDLSQESSSMRQCLLVEQVKVTDTSGNLKTVYPSRVDLVDVPVAVRRD